MEKLLEHTSQSSNSRVKPLFNGVKLFLSRLSIVLLIFITFLPFLLMVHMSLKTSMDIGINFWALPDKPQFSNYAYVSGLLIRPIANSIFVVLFTLAGQLFLVSLSGFAFGKYDFKGKNTLFFLFTAVMMIPSVLMLVPLFFIITRMGLFDTYGALILPYIAGLQVFGIIIARSFYSTLPTSLFEAARIEGAGDGYLYSRIALPLSVPILITIGIQSLIAIYNDYVWPTLVLSGEMKKVFSQAVVTLTSGYAVDYGVMTAGFVVGSIPLVLVTSLCLKYYLQGLLQGAVKG
jgi:ABC-type glycerol-3-phosphate transport system permease component